MNKAEAYSNISLNETVVKFEIDYKGSTNSELIIIADIINPFTYGNYLYNTHRFQIIKEIIPNLNFDLSDIHFIYNDEKGEAKYYYGNIKSIKNINISEIAPHKDNFNKISQKLRELLNGFNPDSYINILTLVNYGGGQYQTDNSIFREYKKKFKNIYSQVLFTKLEHFCIRTEYNYDYISFIRMYKGFASKFFYALPIIFNDREKDIIHISISESYEEAKSKMPDYIENYNPRALPYIFQYLEENMDKQKAKKLEDFRGKLALKRSDDFRNIAHQKIDEYLSKFEANDLKSEKEIIWNFPDKKYLLEWSEYKEYKLAHLNYNNFDKNLDEKIYLIDFDKYKESWSEYKKGLLYDSRHYIYLYNFKLFYDWDPIHKFPYPPYLKEDIIILIEEILVGKIEHKFNLSQSNIDEKKVIKMANQIYEEIQTYARNLIEAGDHKVFFMDCHYYLKQNFNFDFYDRYKRPELIYNNKKEFGTYLFDWKFIPLLLIEGHKCNGEIKFSVPDCLIYNELWNILPNKIDDNENYIKKLLEPYVNLDKKIAQKVMEIKYGKENFVKFLNYIDDKEKEEEKKEEDILKKINKIEEEESSLKEKNKILFGTKEEDFLKNKKGKT